MPFTLADFYDAELRRHNERFRAATGIRPADRVLDVGCGAGQTTREAARAATSGSVLGVDVSEPLLERARQRTADEGLRNVSYELGDAQVHRFGQRQFDVIISRFGTMFFDDPVAAFANIARAAPPGARLVMLVWQSYDRNEWATAIEAALHHPGQTNPGQASSAPTRAKAFSLAEPALVRSILDAAGFGRVDFGDVHEPVFYGRDVESAFDAINSMVMTRDVLAGLDAPAAEAALARLRALLSEHATADGVVFDSRAWIVTATRA